MIAKTMNKISLLYLTLIFAPANLWAAETPPSIFADLPTKELTGTGLSDYLRAFNNAMTNHKTNKPYKWRTGTASGSISVGEEYISKSKSSCRNFTEGYIINGKRGQAQGVACRYDDNNKDWCRLTYEEFRTCDQKKIIYLPEDNTDEESGTEEGE